jgi:hypothetical protein
LEASVPKTVDEQSKPPWQYPKGVSGNKAGRPNIRVRADEIFVALSADFGKLNQTDTLILRQASMMISRSESISSVRHADAAIRLSSESRRLLLMLRRHAPRRADEASLADLLAADHVEQRAAEAEADDVAIVDDEMTVGADGRASEFGSGAAVASVKPVMALDTKLDDSGVELITAEEYLALKRGEAIEP